MQIENSPLKKKKLLHFENAVQTWLVQRDDGTSLIKKVATENAGHDLIEKERWCLKHLSQDDRPSNLLEEGVDSEGNVYFVRQYFPYSLAQKLQQADTITIDEAVEIIQQLFEQLIHLHANGFLNLDVKPDNIFLTSDGQLILSDYGSCFAYSEEATNKTKPLAFWSQRLYVTEDYAHPDLLNQHGPLGPWVDVFAAGKVIQNIIEKMPANQGARLKSVMSQCIDVDIQKSENTLIDCINTLSLAMSDYEKGATRILSTDDDFQYTANNTAQHQTKNGITDDAQNDGKAGKSSAKKRTGFFTLVLVLLAVTVTSRLWVIMDDATGDLTSDLTDIPLNKKNGVDKNGEDKVADLNVFTHDIDVPSDTNVINEHQVDLSSLDNRSTRDLLYQNDVGDWLRVPFVKKVIDKRIVWIAKHEVDNRLYSACVRAGNCMSNTVFSTSESKKRLNQPQMPAVNLSKVMIEEEFLPFATRTFGISMRLLTLQEWQSLSVSARKDASDAVYSMHCKDCLSGYSGNSGGPLAVDAIPPDANGIVHIHGNVKEWLSGCVHDKAGIERCYQGYVAGGSWRDNHKDIMSHPISVLQKRARSIDTGFRIVFDD